MALSDLLASDRTALFATSDFAESVTYTAPDGEQTALTCVVFSEYSTDDEQLGMNVRKRMRGCAINRSELSTVNQHATITVGNADYAINAILSEDDQITVVELARHELIEQTRPGYRRQT